MPYNPKSLENLKPPWKPGESGNPTGRALGSYSFRWKRIEEDFRNALIQDRQGPQTVEEPVDTARALTVEEIDAMGPRIQCRVCSSEHRQIFDGLLTLGISTRTLAKNFGFSRSSVSRHKLRHLPAFPYPEGAREVVKGEKMLSGPIYFLQRADEVYRGRLQACAWRVLGDLCESLVSTFGGGTTGRLQYVCLNAIVHLSYVAARDWLAEKQNRKDLRVALHALESWGRDEETLQTQGE